MLIRTYDFKTAVLISLMVHASVFVVTSLRFFRSEPDLKDYRVVQLVDLDEALRKPAGAARRNARPKAAEPPSQTIETSPTPAAPPQPEKPEEDNSEAADEGGFSSYQPVFKVARLPEFVTKFSPVYPAQAKLKGVEAEVLVEVYIDTEGRPRKAVVVRSGGADFDSATVEAVYKSSFSPAVALDGRSVPVRVRIPFKFELE